MSDRHSYSDQDVLDSLGDLDVELEQESDDYDVRRDPEATRDLSLWYPGADRKFEMRTQGYYANKFPVGAVVHFTAGRSERGDRDAEATVDGGVKGKLCYFCISSTGKVYQAAPLHRWGSHAGVSTYPGLGSSVSKQLVGIEICNAGELKKTAAGYEPWWNENYGSSDSRRTIYTEHQVRAVEKGSNIRSRGVYHAYTPEQEASLINLLLWLRAQKPQVFQWKYVVGHDEVAPNRKTDPGGALSRTMPEFRAYLEQLEKDGVTDVPVLQPAPLPQPKPEPQPEPVAAPGPVVVPGMEEPPAPAHGEAPQAPAEEDIPVMSAPDVAEPQVPAVEATPVAAAATPAMSTDTASSGAAASVPAVGGATASAVAAASVSSLEAKPAVAAVETPAPEPAPQAKPEASTAEGDRANGKTASMDGLDLKIGPEFLALLKAYRNLEIEFPHLKDVTFAQWSLESGYGTSELSVKFKNFAGMKWRRDMALYAREVFYRPAHDPKDSAYCGFETLEAFIKGYWHRLDIKALPYATLNGGWRAHAQSPEAFINFIGPIWAPTGGDNSVLNNGYIRKIKSVIERLEAAGLLPSQGSSPSRSGGAGQNIIVSTPSVRARSVLATRYAEDQAGGARLSEDEVAQRHLVRQISEFAARSDQDGMNSALTQLNALLQKQDAKLGSEDVRKLVSTLVSTHAVRRSGAADSSVHTLVEKIDQASKVVPPRLIEINRSAAQLYGELGGLPRALAPHSVEALVAGLKRAGAFDWLAKITDRLISGGNQQNTVRRNHAEALIELGHVNAATSMLELLLTDQMLPKSERADIEAQLGRAYGQIYVNHVRTTSDAYASGGAFATNLQNAIKYFVEAYEDASPDESVRIGVDLMALLKRAEADGVPIVGVTPAEDIARKIIAKLEPTLHQDSEPSKIAAIGEAYMTVGDFDAAEAWYRGFAISPKLERYKLSEAVRRMEDVWRLADSEDTMRRPLMALKAAETHQRVAQFAVSMEERTQIRSTDFPTMFPDGDLLQYGALRKIVQAGECLAWVKDRHAIPVGAGFMIRGRDIASSLGDDFYLITNTHVICDPNLARGDKPYEALTPEEAFIQFEASPEEGPARTYLLESKAVWQSPASECDVCILRLKDIPEKVSPARIAPIEQDITAGEIEEAADGTPIAVLGTSKGTSVQLGLRGQLTYQQGTIVDIGPRMRTQRQPVFLHYDAPTLPGNAGSPIYDTTNWRVIGLHHAGYNPLEGRPRLYGRAGFHNANEGVYIHSIGMAADRALNGNRTFHWFGR